MTELWITRAAIEYGNYLVDKRKADEQKQREEDLARDHQSLFAAKISPAGAKLWKHFQETVKHDVASFNEEMGFQVLRSAARGDGTFTVTFGEPGNDQKVATMSFEAKTGTLSWKVFGGGDGSISLGLNRGDLEPQFIKGSTYIQVEKISEQILLSLLP